MNGSFQGLIPAKKLTAKEIVENDLLNNAELDEASVMRYCGAANTVRKSNTKSSASVGYILVQQNIDAAIFIIGRVIKQDFKVVGKHKTKTETSNGKVQKQITLMGLGETPIANATYFTFETEASIYLIQTVTKTNIPISNANDLKVLEEIIQYLIYQGNL